MIPPQWSGRGLVALSVKQHTGGVNATGVLFVPKKWSGLLLAASAARVAAAG